MFDNISDNLMVGIVAFTVIAASIAFAVVQDQARMNETKEFMAEHVLSDSYEENEANIDLFINSIK